MRPPISFEEAQCLSALQRNCEHDTSHEPALTSPPEQFPLLDPPNAAHTAPAATASPRFLQATLDALHSQVAVLQSDGTILAINQAWLRFARDNQEIARACGVGSNYLAVCDKAAEAGSKEAAATAQGIRAVLHGQLPEFNLEYPCHSSEEQRWFALCATPCEAEGAPYVVVAHENITERKVAERTLHDREESYRRIVETALEGVWTLDRDFHTTYVNSQMAGMLGYSEEEMLGLSPLEFVFGEDRTWMQGKLRGCQYGFHFRFDGRYRRRDGSELWLLANTRPLWEEGNFVGAFGMYTDITLHKQTEAHQRTLLQGLHAVVEVADELLATKDLETLTRRAVELARKKLGMERCSLYLLRPGDDMARGTYGTDLRGQTTDERSQYFDRAQHWIEPLQDRETILPGAPRWFLDTTHPLRSSDPTRENKDTHVPGRAAWVAATPIYSTDGTQGVLFNDTAISGAPIDVTRQEIVVVYSSLLGNILARQRAEEALHNATVALERIRTRSEPN